MSFSGSFVPYFSENEFSQKTTQSLLRLSSSSDTWRTFTSLARTVWEALTEKVQRCELTTEAGKDNSIVDVPLALYNFRNKAAVNKLTIRYLNRHKKAPIQIVGACVTRLIFFLCACIRFSFNRYLATTRTPARSLSWEAPPCFLNSCL